MVFWMFLEFEKYVKHSKLLSYSESEEMIPMIRPNITEKDIKLNFNNIVQQAKDLILNDEISNEQFD